MRSELCFTREPARRRKCSQEPCSSLNDLGFNEFGQVSQRFLPAEIAGFDRYGIRQSFLHYVELRADQDPLQGHRHANFARQVWVLELVGIAQAYPGE